MGHGTSLETHTHFLSIFICCVYVIISGTNAARYVWKTGLWHECQHDQCGEGGKQYRSVYCAEDGENNYLTVDTTKCSHLQRPSYSKSCFKVCKEHRNDLHWATGVWTDCKLRPGLSQCAIKNGVRYRNVTCMLRSNGRVEDDSACLELEAEPDAEEACDLKCPQDCVVTNFSSWADFNCDTCLIVNRTRTRHLVVPPDPGKGGKPCPPFTEMVACDNCSDVFTYRIGPWQTCIPVHLPSHIVTPVHPVLGFQTRNIQCIDSHGRNVDSYLCVDYLRRLLSTEEIIDSQTCIIPQDCQVSNWSLWSPFNSSCVQQDGRRQQGYMVRTRSINKIPMGAGTPCPNLIHYFPLNSDNERPCVRSKWKMSGWTECEVPRHMYSCTTGLQTRRAYCVQIYADGKEKPVRDKFCTDRQPLTARVCRAECDVDCSVSHWSTWSECKVNDCELYLRQRRNNEGTGQRHRVRKLVMSQQGQGSICPHVSETQTCDPEPCFHWNMTAGPCQLLNPSLSPICGLGIAHRTLSCVNKLGHRVHDRMCRELQEAPSSKEDCDIPCPGDCILSTWSAWSTCPTLCQEGRARPAIHTRERTVLAQSGLGGAPCPPHRQLKEVQTCPTTIECAIYVWQSEPWAECQVTRDDKQCGAGKHSRDVSCYTIHGQLVNDKRCTLKVRPKTQRPCIVPCAVDCEVTEYSDWSACSASCWEVQQTIPMQTRVRYILQEPMYGGRACPNKLMEVKHCNNFTMCHSFYWKEGTWSGCTLPTDRVPQCGQGLQARDISCHQDNGTTVLVDLCVRNVGPIPAVSKTCYKSCDQECMFTDWTEWSMCVSGCHGKRFRTRKLVENGNVAIHQKCRDTRFYPRDSYQDCLCDTYTPIAIGNWSECILEPDEVFYRTPRMFQPEYSTSDVSRAGTVVPRMATYSINSVCGQGLRYKVLACRNDKGEMQAASFCSLRPYKEDRCLLPCPVDCVMSDWSHWTDCSTSCGTGLQLRYRYIRQVPSDGGRLCPRLDNASKDTQTRVCRMDCNQKKWRVYTWDACMPFRSSAICGNGTQSRMVRCEVYSSEGFTDEPVDDQMCFAEFKPQSNQPCYSPCVGECVVSNWTPWSLCKPPCADPNQVQTRTRNILRRPNDDPSHTCPPLLEERFCIRGDNCIVYTWRTSQWTSCLINNGSEDCGRGYRERHALCEEERGRIMDDTYCIQALREWRENSVDKCEIPCDMDCLLTQWTSWSDCSADCDLGSQTRVRDIVEQPTGNGRRCPPTLVENKPCFLRGCYTWMVSPWSECTKRRGQCGHGIQTRNITCLANGGIQVNASNCEPDLDISILSAEKTCSVPCPGECVVSDWTPWNDCFIHCKDYNTTSYTRGVQSRSRVILANAQANYDPCPEQLWESRPCKAGKCFTFIWRTSGWYKNKTRVVWCERSDNLLVTGGCDDQYKPSTNLSCSPECTLTGSFCNNTNTCQCQSGYDPVYNRLNVLIECARMSNLTNASPAPNSVTLPTDGPTNVWMYAVIAAATLFVIFLAVACYTMSEFFNKGPRPRRKDDQQSTSPGAGAGVEFMPNHIQPGTTMLAMPELDSRAGTCTMAVADPDIDSKSVTSIDRTPPNSVRAPACVKLDATSAVRNVPAAMPTVQHMHPSPFSACLHLCRRKSSGDDSFEFQVSNMHELAPLEKNGHAQNNPHAHVQYCVSTLDQPPAYDKTDRPLNWDNNHDETETKLGWSDQESGTGLDHVDAAKVKKMNQANPVKKPERTETCVVRLNDDNLIETQLVAKSHDFESANIKASTNGSVIPGQDGGGICSLGNSQSHQKASIVYLNREASDSDPELATVPEMGHRDSFALMLDTLLDKRLTVNPIDLTVDDDLEAAGETDRLIDAHGPKEMAETSQRISQRQEDTKPECVQALTTPLLGKHKKTNKKSTKSPKPPMLINLKSQSLEQAEHVRSKRFDSDDDSIGNAGSLMSHSSTMSRISKLSMSLGPSIKIDPDEARSYNGRDMQTAMSPHRLKKQTSSLPTNRKGNISYLTYSSVDTETSEDTPSSSISCDSLSPRSETTSEQNQTQSQTPTLNRLKHKNTDSDNKSFRNVAIGSLQRDRDTQKTFIKSDDDSGTDSLNGQGSLPSRTGTKLEGVVSPVKVNGTGSDGLKSPYYYQDTRNKRAILRKQAGSEIDE